MTKDLTKIDFAPKDQSGLAPDYLTRLQFIKQTGHRISFPPQSWNNLPADLTCALTLSSFI